MESSGEHSNVSDDGTGDENATTPGSTPWSIKPQWLHNPAFFGEPSELRGDMLPTRVDVLRYTFFLFERSAAEQKMCPPMKSFAKEVSTRVVDIWKLTNIPMIAFKSVLVKVTREIDLYQSNIKKQSNDFGDYVHSLEKLFDIAHCKCDSSVVCQCGPNQVPESERAFIVDQRTVRVHQIQPRAEEITVSEMDTTEAEPVEQISESEFLPSTDMDAFPSTSTARTYDRMPALPNFAMECDRYGISDRAASALASSLLKDLNVLTSDGQRMIIDRSRVRRARHNAREELLKRQADMSALLAFSFDSRTDKTFAPTTIDNRQHPQYIEETHFVLLRQPNSIYIGHASAGRSTAQEKAQILLNFLRNKNLELGNLMAVCCDGEPTNTGRYDGILRNLERNLDRPIHWFICLLHLNELPLRHLFTKLDGGTTGPKTSMGPIAKQLDDCYTKQVGSFYVIRIKLFLAVIFLNTIGLFYHLCHCGYRFHHLSHRFHCAIYHQRWKRGNCRRMKITCSRLLRLYPMGRVQYK
jgi:hypothetical protein